MNASILNRDFEHPADGWYQIEAKGRHPNRAAGVVQVIDEEAATAIVNRFNADAAAGALRHGNEMLVDHEHFSDQADKESRAYGWLTRLENRADGIYGQIRWTGTGKAAVDGGDYRFFSTEYEPGDCSVVNRTDRTDKTNGLREVRPRRLAGLTLTNMNNNRGQKPITNRSAECGVRSAECGVRNGEVELRRGLGAVAGSQQQQEEKGIERMKSVATKLGLAADASEEAVLAWVTRLMNREAEAQAQVLPLTQRVTALETENRTLLEEQIGADFAAAGVTDEKIVNRHKGLLSDPKHFKNREERVAFIKDLAPKGAGEQKKLLNRETKAPGARAADAGDERGRLVEDYRIKNRCSFESAWSAVQRARPELFQPEN